ncbi:MAG TPA: ABC transporter ATP-binding protein [Polyangiaceae bacterium]|nr:ABC transporter ATP-binding protein [Polyangiaceae bacterium]
MIQVEALSVNYGAATALDAVSLNVRAGEKVALIGANGAGKSTLLNALSGIVAKTAGTIRIDGRWAHVPEGRQLFPDLSVEDNLRLGAFRERVRDPAWVYELLPELARFRRQRAGSLSGGQQQMVAIGRGLMARPDVIAIDEMSLGLAPIIVQKLAAQLNRLNAERGLTLLLVEQSARLALSLCDRAYVLETGRIVAQGPSAELEDSPFVERAYLGGPLEGSS